MEKSISISYSDSFLPADAFWAVFDQEPEEVEDENVVSFKDAAEMIDELYDIKACGTEEEQEEAATGGESASEESPFPTYAEYQARMKQIFSANNNVCENVFVDNSYKATLRVFRSHIDKSYKVVLSNGSIDSVSSGSTLVTDVLTVNGYTVSTSFPIRYISSSTEVIKDHNSGTILFEKYLIGVVTVTYQTSYEAVKIVVNAEDGERGSCECLLFYQSTVSEVSVSPPDIDETVEEVLDCNGDGTYDDSSESNDDVPEEIADPKCYQRYIYNTSCDCAPYTTKDTVDEVREIPCTKSVGLSDREESAYNSFQDAIKFESYIRCPEAEDWEGQDPEFYEDECCEPPTGPLPTCQERKAIDYGGRGITNGADYYKNNAFANESVSVVPVSPKNGICGEITTKYEIPDRDCCDDPFYTDLEFWEEACVEVLPDYSYGVVFWTGGKSPVTVSIRGDGFYANGDYTKTTVKVEGNSAFVFSEDACGICDVIIEDGCSSDTYSFKAVDGIWKNVPCDMCAANFTPTWAANGNDYSGLWTYEDTKYKFSQWVKPSRGVYQRYDTCGEACGEYYIPSDYEDPNWVGWDCTFGDKNMWWGHCSRYRACEYWDGFVPIYSLGPNPGWSPVKMVYQSPSYQEWSC